MQVQKSGEKIFVHGRYMKPTVALSRARTRTVKGNRKQKRVTFFCLPFFSMESLRTYRTDKHNAGFPVRSLMQSVYRLESMRQRDSNQISGKQGENGKVIHVPELWGLIIGKRKSPDDQITFFACAISLSLAFFASHRNVDYSKPS